MLTLGQAVTRNSQAGEPLSFPWKRLAEAAVPRRAQVTMLFGPSGSCKSMMGLGWVMDLQVPTLYLSPDTDHHDMALRALAQLTGHNMTDVERGLQTGYGHYENLLTGLSDWLKFSFDPSPTLDDIDLEIQAFDEMYGATPELIVVDTLTDVQCDDADEYRGMRLVMGALHHLARTTGASVLVVHHTTGEYDGHIAPAPRRAINGKVSKVPELILSVARSGEHLGVAVVKQRQGFSDPTADNPIWLQVDAARAAISDPQLTIASVPSGASYYDQWDAKHDFD